MRAVSPEEVTAGAEALVRWTNPPHAARVVNEMDRQAAQAVLAAAAEKRVQSDDAAFPRVEREAVQVDVLPRSGGVAGVRGLDDPRKGIPTKDEGLSAEHLGWLLISVIAFACGVIVGWQW